MQPLLFTAAPGMWAVTCHPALCVGAKTHSFYLPQFPSGCTWAKHTHPAPVAGASLSPAPFAGIRALTLTYSHCWHYMRDLYPR